MDIRPTKTRRKRASVPHVKSGCFTCKTRRVKCDERRPKCQRCQKFGIECDGYSYPANLIIPKITASSKPKTTLSPTIQTKLFENTIEKNYFDFWQRKRVIEAYTPLDSAAWAQLIFQSSHISSIRFCIIALGALELALGQAHAERAISPSMPSGDSIKIHHRTAMKYFDKALKQMRADTISKSQTLRTTLVTCVLIHWFESFNGNYSLAVAQIRTADELLSEWRSSLRKSSSQLRLPSPVPEVVEDELVQAIGNLTVQTFSEPDSRPPERRIALKQDSIEMSRMVPSTFSSVRQARQYLDIIIKSSLYVISSFLPATVSDPYSYTVSLATSYPVNDAEFQKGKTSSLSATGDGMIEDQREKPPLGINSTQSIHTHQNPPTITRGPYPPNEQEREIILAKLRLWRQAFKNLPSHLKNPDSTDCLLLQLHRQACTFGLNSLLVDYSYDEYHSTILSILDIATKILDSEYTRLGPNTTTFIPDLGVILPLYFIGIICLFPPIRARIISLLLSQSRREGVWDSLLVGKVVEWVRDLEEVYLEGEGENKMVPRWARVERIETNCDLLRRTAKVGCWQRTGPGDAVGVKKETVLTW